LEKERVISFETTPDNLRASITRFHGVESMENDYMLQEEDQEDLMVSPSQSPSAKDQNLVTAHFGINTVDDDELLM
jgi:hypothetical protein